MSRSTLAILQARMSSTRLPGKVMMEINGHPMIYWQIHRILSSRTVDELVVATSSDASDDELASFLKENSINVHRGSLDNVLSRFIEVSRHYPHDALIRLTGDCPLVMPELIDRMVLQFHELDIDYLSNTLEPTFPDGLDIEILKEGVLDKLALLKLNQKELEHVTYGVYTRPKLFKSANFRNTTDCSAQRWTVDYQPDLDFARRVFLEFRGRETIFTYQEVNEFLRGNPELQADNYAFKRNERLHKEENHG